MKIEPCNCEQSQTLIGNQKILLETIAAQKLQIRTLHAAARARLRLEELVRRTVEDCERVSYKDVGHKCESRKVVEKISQRFADYQKERGGE